MNPPTTVIVGSLSELKRDAVQDALNFLDIKAEVVTKMTGSGQNAQPYGARDTYEGARIRAYANCEDGADDYVWSVGIESGIMPLGLPEHRFDITFVVVRAGGGRVEVATSAGILVPPDFIEEAQQRGSSTTTIGDVVHERTGWSPANDAHAGLTLGRVNRREIIAQAVKATFAKLLAD